MPEEFVGLGCELQGPPQPPPPCADRAQIPCWVLGGGGLGREGSGAQSLDHKHRRGGWAERQLSVSLGTTVGSSNLMEDESSK